MTLRELLDTRGVDRVLIVDDGYDATPTAADLSVDQGAWANFIADLAIHHDAVEAAYPGYSDVPTDDLVNDDRFVRALWDSRGGLDEGAWQELFGQYERDEESDRGFLEQLERRLAETGLAVQRAGRNTPIEDGMVPLVFVDLFLGGAQDPEAMEDSIGRVRDLLRGREDDPPLVVLMSRSERLDLNRDRFRSETGLLGAMFRVSPKRALLADGGLERVLTRLAHHRDDGRRLATFLNAWDRGLGEARGRFMEKVRRLDLPDYAQIRDLLVAFEGQPLGSYLLDVFDRVLQFEIEADTDTIAAASAMAEVDLSQYLAPHIAGSPDLQELVHRTIYQNPARLAVPTTVGGVPLAFGDVLADAAAVQSGENMAGRRVLAVMTPACDLVRPGCRHVLMLGGTLRALGPRDWSYGAEGARTPVIILPAPNGAGRGGERRYWIAWDLRDLATWAPAEVAAMMHPRGAHVRVTRLREGAAVELQQRMLGEIGRLGQVAHLPATFAVSVELHRVGPDGVWAAAHLPALARDGGVCFEGRDADSDPNVRLVISEAACDEIAAHVAAIGDRDVPADARQSLERLQAGTDLTTRLENGLDVSRIGATFSQITAPRTTGERVINVPIAVVSRNPTGAPHPSLQRSAVVAIVMRDLATAPGRVAPPSAATGNGRGAGETAELQEPRA